MSVYVDKYAQATRALAHTKEAAMERIEKAEEEQAAAALRLRWIQRVVDAS